MTNSLMKTYEIVKDNFFVWNVNFSHKMILLKKEKYISLYIILQNVYHLIPHIVIKR